MDDVRGTPFGRVLTAMVTPMRSDRSVDLDGAAALAAHLVDHGSDGLVVSGTTGEAPTTTDAEKRELLRVVLDAVGDRARVLAGVGTNDTAHTVELARQAAGAGAHGLLVVTPYYSKPPQAGLREHFLAVADATDLPVMLYDIPGRTAVPIATETLLAVAEHPRIRAVKDAKGDFESTSTVIAGTDLAYYSGDDLLTLPLMSLGAVGVVSVVSHVVGERMAAMVAAYAGGDLAAALKLHQDLLPVFVGTFRTQGVILTKASLTMLGLPGGPVRPPLADATEEEVRVLRTDLEAGGVALGPAPVAGGREALA